MKFKVKLSCIRCSVIEDYRIEGASVWEKDLIIDNFLIFTIIKF